VGGWLGGDEKSADYRARGGRRGRKVKVQERKEWTVRETKASKRRDKGTGQGRQLFRIRSGSEVPESGGTKRRAMSRGKEKPSSVEGIKGGVSTGRKVSRQGASLGKKSPVL